MDESNGKAGAPEGNQNAKAGSLVRGAIRRALAENEAKGRQSLLNIVHKIIDKAEDGDLPFAKELFDRLDGKPNQSLSGPDGNELKLVVATGLPPTALDK